MDFALLDKLRNGTVVLEVSLANALSDWVWFELWGVLLCLYFQDFLGFYFHFLY
jgi:hypothetical protein